MNKNSALSTFLAKHKYVARQIEHKCTSERVFVLRELSGNEQRAIDSYHKEFNGFNATYWRVAASIVSIDGDDVPELNNGKELDEFLDVLSIGELTELLNVFLTEFMVRGEELKNESSSTLEPNAEQTPELPASPGPKPKK